MFDLAGFAIVEDWISVAEGLIFQSFSVLTTCVPDERKGKYLDIEGRQIGYHYHL
jgi:hypothetical protein